jgi:hypothetical protein
VLLAGVVTDRFDRAGVLVLANLARVGVLAVRVSVIAGGEPSVGVVLAVLTLRSVAEVFANTSSSALVPTLVPRDHRAVANARLMTGVVTLNQLAGPPVGAALFALGPGGRSSPSSSWSSPGSGWSVGSSAACAPGGRRRRAVDRSAPRRPDPGPHHPRVQPDVRGCLVRARPVRERPSRLGAVGFGLLTTASAVGGLIGTSAHGWITRHASLGVIMRVGLVIEAVTRLILALTTSAWVAVPVFVVFGATPTP